MNSFNLVIYNNSALYSIIEEFKKIFLLFKISTHITDQNNLVKNLDQNPQTIIVSSL